MVQISNNMRSIRNISNLASVILAINLLFWIWIAIDIVQNIQPWTDREPEFEEIVPVYKFGRQAILASSDHKMLSLQIMRTVQQPTYFIVVKVANYISNGSWDKRLGSLSIGSFVIIATMVLSFLQWGTLAWLVRIFTRIRK